MQPKRPRGRKDRKDRKYHEVREEEDDISVPVIRKRAIVRTAEEEDETVVDLYSGDHAIEYLEHLFKNGKLLKFRQQVRTPVDDFDRVLNELIHFKFPRMEDLVREKTVSFDVVYSCSLNDLQSSNSHTCVATMNDFITPAELLPDGVNEEYDPKKLIIQRVEIQQIDDPKSNEHPIPILIGSSLHRDLLQEAINTNEGNVDQIRQLGEMAPLDNSGRIMHLVGFVPVSKDSFDFERKTIMGAIGRSKASFAKHCGGLNSHNLTLGVYIDEENNRAIFSAENALASILKQSKKSYLERYRFSAERYDKSKEERRKIISMNLEAFSLMLSHIEEPFLNMMPYKNPKNITFEIYPHKDYMSDFAVNACHTQFVLRKDPEITYNADLKRSVAFRMFVTYLIYPLKSNALPYYPIGQHIWNEEYELSESDRKRYADIALDVQTLRNEQSSRHTNNLLCKLSIASSSSSS